MKKKSIVTWVIKWWDGDYLVDNDSLHSKWSKIRKGCKRFTMLKQAKDWRNLYWTKDQATIFRLTKHK